MSVLRYLSLFSGIEAASAAWLPLGWTCAAFAEIDPFPCAVLKHHYPGIPNLGDVTKITKARIESLGHIDLVVFGSPCQDLSVAGKRAGLKGERSGLFFDAMRVVRWSRARYALFENVPGLLSSNEGRDFAAVVGEMVGVEPDVPADGWQNSGAFLGPDGLVEMAILDAKFFGVPQRRRRVFALRDIGNWADRPPILLERESLSGHPPPSRETGEGVAVCPTLRSGGNRTGGDRPPGTDVDTADSLIVSALAPTISARTKGGDGLGTDFDLDGGLAHALNAKGGSGRSAFESETFIPTIAPCLTQNYGKQPDNSDTSAGPMLIPILEAGARTGKSTSDIRAGIGIGDPGDPMFTLQSGKQHAIAIGLDEEQNASIDGFGCLKARTEGGGFEGSVMTNSAVRRLLPEECEKLQGFPPGYTSVPYRGKPDGPRYKALGNSMAVPCMAWIGSRIQAVEQLKSESEAA